MKKFLTFAGIAFFSLTGLAHASTLLVTLGPTLSFGSGTALNPSIDLATDSGLTLNNASIIATPTPSTPTYVVPSGTLANNDFLSVYGGQGATPPGAATFALTPGLDTFGFTWGTIDKYNTLLLTDSHGMTYVITGAEILNQLGGSIPGTTQEDVKFTDPFGAIVSAILTSTQDSFEAANFSQSEMPLPPAFLMFGSALLGFVFLTCMRQRKTA